MAASVKKETAISKKKKTVSLLMIGSTGNGKSTLGNFLLNPDDDHITGDNQAFKTAQTNVPQTQKVDTKTFLHKESFFTVVDTPGLNESDDKDLEHMIDIIKLLQTMKSVGACVLCTKFDAKIDAQYRATIAYYRKLLPELFEKNVVVVMTSFATDKC